MKEDKLIIWGGDGTLNETIIGLFKTNQDAKIAFIPMGTTNDFGRSLKVSFDELAVSKKLSTYKVKEIDMGTIDGIPFNYVVSVGLFSKASYQTSRKWKNRIGKAAYYLNGVKELFHYKTHKLKFIFDDKVVEDDFLYGSISNSKYMGGFPVFRKYDVKLDDGEFEVLLAKKPKNIFATIIVVIEILTGHLNKKHISLYKASKLIVEAENEIDICIDGEYGGKKKKFEIKNNQKKTKYLVP